MNPPLRLVRWVLAWPVESQQGSRRNALVASTEFTRRRLERDDVEEFLARRAVATLAVPSEPVARRDVI